MRAGVSNKEQLSCVCVCLESKVRLATLELSCLLLKQSVFSGSHCIIKDVHLACLEVRPSVQLQHAFRDTEHSGAKSQISAIALTINRVLIHSLFKM